MTSIRPLTAGDVDALVSALAQAFERDDLAVWIFPDPAERGPALVAMFRSRLSDGLHHDGTVVDVAEDLDGAAIWQSPLVPLDEAPPPGVRSEVVEAFRTIYAARPRAPHWYLHGIGARTAGRGLGSALLSVGLQRLDQAGLPTALFTGAERNVSFYRKHGYRELSRSDFPGASVWWMWRDPAPGPLLPASEGAIHSSAEEVVRAHIAALNGHDLEAAHALVAADCVRHVGWRDVWGPDAPGQGGAERSWQACPDWRYDLQAIVGAGDLVAVMVRASGRHTGGPLELPGLGTFPATGRVLRAAWSCIYRVTDGRIVEQWQTSDLLVLLRDLGALPAK